MRALMSLILGLLLFAGLANGSVLHAVELGAGTEVTAGTEWLHGEHDHDEVPADADKDYPHHHNQCHGHDLAAPVKLCGAPVPERIAIRLKPAPTAAMDTGPAPRLLRPPIA